MTHAAAPTPSSRSAQGAPSPLWATLAFTFANSIGTGIATAGVFFITEHTFGFSGEQNFALALVFGVTYIPAALVIGPGIRRFARVHDWLSTRAVLAALMLVHGAACLLPPLAVWLTSDRAGAPSGAWSVWLFVAIYGPLNGSLWPIVESYVSGGRAGARLRSATGRFNIVWSSALVVCLFAIAPLFAAGEENIRLPLFALAGLGLLHFVSALLLVWFRPEPGRHLPEHHEPHPPAYRPLLRAFRVLLPISFLVIATLEPWLPYGIRRLGIDPGWKTPVASTWMASRVLTFLVLERWHGWHGRWETPALGWAAMLVGFTIALLSPGIESFGLPLMLIGLAVAGVGIGIIYASALYYAMEVGNAEVDAGGTHEALIGLGYAAGPLIGLAASGLARADVIESSSTQAAIVQLVAAACVLAGVGAWARARKVSREPRIGPPTA